MCGTLSAHNKKEAPVVFVAVNSNGDDTCGPLAARDFKGVGNQYVEEGKVVCQRTC